MTEISRDGDRLGSNDTFTPNEWLRIRGVLKRADLAAGATLEKSLGPMVREWRARRATTQAQREAAEDAARRGADTEEIQEAVRTAQTRPENNRSCGGCLRKACTCGCWTVFGLACAVTSPLWVKGAIDTAESAARFVTDVFGK